MQAGPLEVPDGVLIASASFVMEARLEIGIPVVALGRVTRLNSKTSGVALLPSAEIYALNLRRG